MLGVKPLSHKIDGARERLLAEGKKMLAEAGFDRLNIRALVGRCGISTGTFYNTFGSKEALTVDILKADWDRILRDIDAVSSVKMPFREKLEQIYASVHAFFHSYKNVFLEMLLTNTPAPNSNAEIKRSFCDRMTRLLRSETDSGTFRTPLDAERLSYIILQNFIYMSKEDYITFDDFYRLLNAGGRNDGGTV